MTKRLKVFLPKWTRWIVLAVLVPIWGLLLYSTFSSSDHPARTAPLEFMFATLVLAAVAAVIWLSASGRLPTHVVEIEEDDDRPHGGSGRGDGRG
ncbi:MAG TPA: hypothetical protein VGK93_00870 [Candidatus Eisenbacteria bacterium]|jgi:hypothetical protein